LNLDKCNALLPHLVEIFVFTNVDIFFRICSAKMTDYSRERVSKDS
jgi:hypothetical protein